MFVASVKIIAGVLPVGVCAFIAQALGQDSGTLVGIGGGCSAGFYFAMWRAEIKSHKDTWKLVERLRGERDRERVRCVNCAGNEVRRKSEVRAGF